MKNILFMGLLACALQVSAQTGTSESKTMGARLLPEGIAGFVELSSGYTANNDKIPVEGVPSSIKILGSYYTINEHGVFDLGVGTHTQTFIDSGRTEASTTTTVMEAAARYQFENRWQFGVVYNQFFDRGKNYFSNQADAEFGGLQLTKEMTIGGGDTNLRIGIRAMRDINTDNHDIDIAMLDVAFGMNPRR